MLKKIILAITGKANYVKYVIFITKLYRSYTPFKSRAKGIIKQHLIPRGGVVLDIGANIGRFTSLAASLVKKSGTVHSFEPVTITFNVLKKAVALKKQSQAVINNIALSDKNGSAKISIPLKDGWKPKLPVAHMGADTRATLEIETNGYDKPTDYLFIHPSRLTENLSNIIVASGKKKD